MRGTDWSFAIAHQLLARYGVVFRETAHAEGLPGGFSAIYDVMKALEESGKVRRGYFAADLGATQFAMPAAVDLLRSLRIRRDGDKSEMLMLAATDPANPYGSLLKWPAGGDASSSLTRSVGARVILCDGKLIAYLRRGNPNLQAFLPEEEPARSQSAKALAEFLVERSHTEGRHAGHQHQRHRHRRALVRKSVAGRRLRRRRNGLQRETHPACVAGNQSRRHSLTPLCSFSSSSSACRLFKLSWPLDHLSDSTLLEWPRLVLRSLAEWRGILNPLTSFCFERAELSAPP